MLRDRKIAFFIDLYNTELLSDNYKGIVEQVSAMGEILCGTIYGASERSHREVLADAQAKGYRTLRTQRVRGRKVFDNRIFVDVVDRLSKTDEIDTVCIIAKATDMVYLYTYLRERGIKIIALNNSDEVSNAFVAEFVDSGKVDTIKLPKQPKPKKQAKPKAEPKVEQKPVVAEPQVAAQPVVQQPVQQPAQNVAAEVDEMSNLLKEIDRLRAETQQVQQAKPVEQVPVAPQVAPVEQPVVQPAPQVVQPAPQVAPVEQAPAEQKPRVAASQSDAELFRRIEEMKKNGASDDEVAAEVLKLLSDVE